MSEGTARTRDLAMVIQTELGSFSELPIYPGHGTRFARKDGTIARFLNSKCASLAHQRKKPSKLTWTQAWRRQNKKANVETTSKRRTRRTTKQQRSIVGISLEDIRKRRAAKPAPVNTARAKALAEAKAAKKTGTKKVRAAAGGAPAQAAAAKHAGKGR